MLDPGTTRWRDLIALLEKCRVLDEAQLRLVREINQARIGVAHGGSYSGTRENLEEYAALVEDVLQNDSPSSDTAPVERVPKESHTRNSREFSTADYHTLVEYATRGYGGLGLDQQEAVRWADRWSGRLGGESPYEFTQRFHTLVEYATRGYGGLGLDQQEAVRWADRWSGRLGGESPYEFTQRFHTLVEYATRGYGGLGLDQQEAVRWAEGKISGERGDRPKGRGRRPERY